MNVDQDWEWTEVIRQSIEVHQKTVFALTCTVQAHKRVGCVLSPEVIWIQNGFNDWNVVVREPAICSKPSAELPIVR